MKLRLLTVDDQLTQYEKDGKVFKSRTVLCVDADESGAPKVKQMFELTLPADHAPIGRGKLLDIVPETFTEFDGRARIRVDRSVPLVAIGAQPK